MKLRDKILNQPTLEMIKVWVSDWQSHVYLKPLSIKEHEAWESVILNEDGTTNKSISLKASMVVASCYDENGDKVFTEKDLEALGEQAAGPINKLFAKCSKINAISKSDVEELEGNSGKTSSSKR